MIVNTQNQVINVKNVLIPVGKSGSLISKVTKSVLRLAALSNPDTVNTLDTELKAYALGLSVLAFDVMSVIEVTSSLKIARPIVRLVE